MNVFERLLLSYGISRLARKHPDEAAMVSLVLGEVLNPDPFKDVPPPAISSAPLPPVTAKDISERNP